MREECTTPAFVTEPVQIGDSGSSGAAAASCCGPEKSGRVLAGGHVVGPAFRVPSRSSLRTSASADPKAVVIPEVLARVSGIALISRSQSAGRVPRTSGWPCTDEPVTSAQPMAHEPRHGYGLWSSAAVVRVRSAVVAIGAREA